MSTLKAEIRGEQRPSGKEPLPGNNLEAISKIVDHVQGRDENRFKNRAYTLVFEYFESVCNKVIGR